jgi:hypothetical protein
MNTNNTYLLVRPWLTLSALAITAITAAAQGPSIKPGGTTGQISGTVRDDAGVPVAGAQVLVGRTFPIVGVTGARAFNTVTDAQGRYSVANLSAGSYKICPSAADRQLLDPCLWAAKQPLVNLVAGQNAVVNVALETGSYVQVRVDDPGAKVAAVENQNSGVRPYSLSIRSTHGTPIDLDEMARDKNGRNYWVLVPKATDVALKFDPGQMNVSRQDGSKVSATDASETVRGLDSATAITPPAGKGPGAAPGPVAATFLRFQVNYL